MDVAFLAEAVLCCAVLCCAVLCCVVLCEAVLCCIAFADSYVFVEPHVRRSQVQHLAAV